MLRVNVLFWTHSIRLWWVSWKTSLHWCVTRRKIGWPSREILHVSPIKRSRNTVTSNANLWVRYNYITSLPRVKPFLFYCDICLLFPDVLRANEYGTSLGVVTTTHTEYNLETSDFFRVYCESEDSQFRWGALVF